MYLKCITNTGDILHENQVLEKAVLNTHILPLQRINVEWKRSKKEKESR